MAKELSRNVFIPGALPESTYIIRKSEEGFTYEERLEQALSFNGYMTLISGPSKIGKTVLCEKVIGLDNLVEVSGSDFSEDDNIWLTIGAKAGMPINGISVSSISPQYSSSESYVITKESVIDFFHSHGLVLLVDDFHYANAKTQNLMAQQFKDAIRRGFKIIIASLPHRSDDSIRTNPDLQGRISIIDIASWTKQELIEIPKKGFSELNVAISDVCIDRLANESICSPQLMQLICLNLCILAGVDKNKKIQISPSLLDKAFRFSTSNLDYKKVTDCIRQGKNSRGNRRKKYQTTCFGKLDLYELIIEAMAIDPPINSISFDELMQRIQRIVDVDEIKPTAKSLKGYLKNLQEVLNTKDRSFEVVEWKDGTLYILESLFLFYLRWGRI